MRISDWSSDVCSSDLPDWYRRFPDATVHLAPGVVERARRPLPPHRLLGDAAPEEWAGEIDQVLVPGGIVSEVDFFHYPSRTLVLTDLIENIRSEERRVGDECVSTGRSRW